MSVSNYRDMAGVRSDLCSGIMYLRDWMPDFNVLSVSGTDTDLSIPRVVDFIFDILVIRYLFEQLLDAKFIFAVSNKLVNRLGALSCPAVVASFSFYDG